MARRQLHDDRGGFYLVEDGDLPANLPTLLTRLSDALVALKGFVDTPNQDITAAMQLQTLKLVCRCVIALARLQLGRFDSAD